MSDEHDESCESEFVVEAGAYTPCDCENRRELRRRGFVVVRPKDIPGDAPLAISADGTVVRMEQVGGEEATEHMTAAMYRDTAGGSSGLDDMLISILRDQSRSALDGLREAEVTLWRFPEVSPT